MSGMKPHDGADAPRLRLDFARADVLFVQIVSNSVIIWGD